MHVALGVVGRLDCLCERYAAPRRPTPPQAESDGIGPAPARRFLPRLIDLVWDGTIHPGKVFDLTLPLSEVAEGYRAMDERRAIKTLLQV